VSDLRLRKGQVITADKWNGIVDRLPDGDAGIAGFAGVRLVPCRLTEDIAAATIDEADTEDSVYPSGVVDTYGLINNGDGTFSPGITNEQKILLNATTLPLSSGAEVWAMESWLGTLVFSQAKNSLYRFTLNEAWSSGAANADILEMDGTDTGTDADVLDPLGIFSELGDGDAGLCMLQGGVYYVIQAPCPS
jgi:hypothetical protein